MMQENIPLSPDMYNQSELEYLIDKHNEELSELDNKTTRSKQINLKIKARHRINEIFNEILK